MLGFLREVNWIAVIVIVAVILALYYFFLGDFLNGILDNFSFFRKSNGSVVVTNGINGKTNGMYKVDWINTPHPSGNYGPMNPAERLGDLIAEFGKPDLIDPSSGGMALWNEETLRKLSKCWERIEIIDEQIPHDDPAPHTDFVYGEYKLVVPDNLVDDVRNLSKSITYDPLKKILTARCHAMGPVKATALLAMYIATGRMSGREAKSKYSEYVLATAPGSENFDPMAESRYERELCEYHNALRGQEIKEVAKVVKEEVKEVVEGEIEKEVEKKVEEIVKSGETESSQTNGEAGGEGEAEGEKIEGFCSVFGIPYSNFP